ncbi:hypothetical protein C8F04DRAFT_1155975 [Mycena alexandri]|uniref:Uncharacterized protein n=1 Tax=Mycena alexandri TaxID=1745969 RepID=A0AAD6WKR1_9AGAR|nr:hypothetical protein C8F04DRAFT_1155975 [Mycena alexandri]
MLKAQNEILQSNFNALLSSLSNTTTAQPAALSPLVTLNEADYPRAKHWQKKSWTKQIQHDAGRTSKTNRATKNCLLFITNQEGEPPTQDVLEDIRKLSYSVFFGCEREGILPAVWSQAGHDVLNRFRSTLEAAFPDLRLCHRHWKADRLAGKVFMAWCGTHRKKVKVENNSDDDSDDGNSDADNGDETDSGEVVVHAQKRSASVLSHGAEPRPKRAKPDSASSSERPLERTQDKGKRRTKNPLFNKTPATITTTGTLVVSASSSSAIAPTLPPPTSPSALVPPASAVPSPSTSTLNPLAPPSPFTSIANPLAAPSALSVIMPTPPVPATNPVASPQLTQPVAAPIPAQTSTTLNLEPAPQPKAWKRLGKQRASCFCIQDRPPQRGQGRIRTSLQEPFDGSKRSVQRKGEHHQRSERSGQGR